MKSFLEVEETDKSCHDSIVKHDAIWSSLSIIISITPLVIGFTGCCITSCITSKPAFYPVRLFCYSFTTYVGWLTNCWIFPTFACPGVRILDYPSSMLIAVQVGWAIIPTGLILSWIEFLMYSSKNRLFKDIKLEYSEGTNMEQSKGFDTVRSYLLQDNEICPLKVEVRHKGRCNEKTVVRKWKHTPKLRTRYDYHGNARLETAMEFENGAELKSKHLHNDYVDFKYDRIEDHSDKLPDFSTLKSWQAVQIKLSEEVLPGDQLTLNQVEIWKEEHKRKFWKYTYDTFEESKNGHNLVEYEEIMRLKGLKENVLIYATSTKPWYLTPECWVIVVCGLLCLLWIPQCLGLWRIKNVKAVIRKKFFINEEKYQRSIEE